MGRLIETARSIGEFKPFTDGRFYTGEVYSADQREGVCRYRFEIVRAGPLPIASYCGDDMGLRRAWKHIRQSMSELFTIWFPEAGATFVTQDQVSDACCLPGSFAITYGGRPFHVRSSRESGDVCRHNLLMVPSHLMRSLLPNVDRLGGRVFGCLTGPAATARQIVSSIMAQGEELSNDCRRHLGMAALTAVCDSVRSAVEKEPVLIDARMVQAARVLRFIDRNLPMQGLTAEQVAAGCNMSRRHLHYILKEYNTSFGEYLREARLKQAHVWLNDPEFAHFHVVEIAYMCGFRNASHFSKVYRQRFGSAPSDQRMDVASAGRA